MDDLSSGRSALYKCRLFNCVFPSKLFSTLFRAAKTGLITPNSDDRSTNEKGRGDIGKSSWCQSILHPHIINSNENGSATGIKDGGKVVTTTLYPRLSLLDRRSRKSTVHGAKSATTKYGGKIATHGSTFSIQTANKILKSLKQHAVPPPPKVHIAAALSEQAEITTGLIMAIFPPRLQQNLL